MNDMNLLVASDQTSIPDALGHAVGPERFELLARLAGNEVYLSSILL